MATILRHFFTKNTIVVFITFLVVYLIITRTEEPIYAITIAAVICIIGNSLIIPKDSMSLSTAETMYLLKVRSKLDEIRLYKINPAYVISNSNFYIVNITGGFTPIREVTCFLNETTATSLGLPHEGIDFELLKIKLRLIRENLTLLPYPNLKGRLLPLGEYKAWFPKDKIKFTKLRKEFIILALSKYGFNA